jgi:hypothetical protein
METSEFTPGVIIRVPARDDGTHRSRPWCLEIIKVISVSRETGAVDLLGRVLGRNGTTARQHPLLRRVTVMPGQTEQFSPPLRPGEPIPPERSGGMTGYVAGKCGHRVAASEWRAGFRNCERCGG